MVSTTLTSWALLIWNTLKEQGIDPEIAFDKAGLDKTKLGDCQARYKMDKMHVLWQSAVELSGDEDIGVSVGQHWSPTSFHALGFAWLASHSLIEGLQRIVRYGHVVSDGLETDLKKEGAFYRFSFLSTGHPAAEDAAISCVLKMCQLLMDDTFSPVSIELKRSYRQPGVLEAHAGVSFDYDKNINSFIFDAISAEKNLPTGNASLIAANEKVAQDYLVWIKKHDIISNVRAQLIAGMPAGSTTETDIAEKLNLTVRTLQRKLEKENYSFSRLINETREEVALNHIKNNQLSLTEIAYLLGFSDQANFTRAFKRWTGKTPSDFRTGFISSQAAGL